MRVVHSFSSYHCTDETLFMHMCYFILSCIYAKRSGFEIAVHCDERAKKYLQLAPYDEIITDLEGIIPIANSSIYAWSKFAAMQNESLGAIHIDGDVFLKDAKLIDLLNFDDYDCIVQCLENVNTYGSNAIAVWNNSKAAFKNIDYPEWAKRQCKYMYNCGVIGFNNEVLKKEYFETYEHMVEEYNKKGIDAFGVPDIIIEQQFLKDLTDYRNYSVKCLLPECNFAELNSYSNDIGYQHVIGNAKRKNIDTALKLIRYYNKDIYSKLTELRNKH